MEIAPLYSLLHDFKIVQQISAGKKEPHSDATMDSCALRLDVPLKVNSHLLFLLFSLKFDDERGYDRVSFRRVPSPYSLLHDFRIVQQE